VQPTAEINEAAGDIPMRGVRGVVAERLLSSVTSTAHVTLTAEADATALVELRHQLGGDGVAASYNDLFLYILGHALREHPGLNSSLEGDVIKLWRRIHIGLAVDTDRGLLVPVVRDVDRKGLHQLAGETQALTERARLGECTPDDLRGGTFTLTNLGMFGIDAFTPLINPPECAILGVGRIKRRPVMVDDEILGRHLVWLSLTFDHRLVDGAPAARFLQRVVQLVESPHLLLA
jgi:pyruvate dehydrogenase E2 component (dihydrolipoamide acetyltransferase)